MSKDNLRPSRRAVLNKDNLRPTHRAVLNALTDEPRTVIEVHYRRMEAAGAPRPWSHGTAATLAALDLLEYNGFAILSKNEHGASCYRLARQSA